MNRKILPAYRATEDTFDVIDDLQVKIDIASNPYQIPAEVLFAMAARNNPKRPFLFVSKILGKHLPIAPAVGLLGGALLASRYLEVVYGIKLNQTAEIVQTLISQKKCNQIYHKVRASACSLPEPVQFIGFAETATGLGHSMFAAFANNGLYLHTTRDLVHQAPRVINFEEEHSHAVQHHCYPLNDHLFKVADQVVLVDDELTTGKTVLNIISALQQLYPRKKYVVASLLDWRSAEDKRQFDLLAEQLGITIQTVSLISGSITVTGKPREVVNQGIGARSEFALFPKAPAEIHQINLSDMGEDLLSFSSKALTGEANLTPYLKGTGRFGITSSDQQKTEAVVRKVGQLLRQTRRGKKTLCLGSGEFIYLPMAVAAYMGKGVKFHSTTRSPIVASRKEKYPVQNAWEFPSPDDHRIVNYLYNIPVNYYDDVYLFLEREVTWANLQPLIKVLNKTGIPRVFLVIWVKGLNTGGKEISDGQN